MQGPPPLGSEDRVLQEVIERDIIDRSLGTTFEDIASLSTAKRLLKVRPTRCIPLSVLEQSDIRSVTRSSQRPRLSMASAMPDPTLLKT